MVLRRKAVSSKRSLCAFDLPPSRSRHGHLEVRGRGGHFAADHGLPGDHRTCGTLPHRACQRCVVQDDWLHAGATHRQDVQGAARAGDVPEDASGTRSIEPSGTLPLGGSLASKHREPRNRRLAGTLAPLEGVSCRASLRLSPRKYPCTFSHAALARMRRRCSIPRCLQCARSPCGY